MKFRLTILVPAMAFIASCNDTTPHYNDPVPKHQTIEIQSALLKEKRIINIWTPPSYDSLTDSLPVMYMADGGVKEDFYHIVHTFDSLIGAKAIPPFILVGIENTVRRRDLSGPTEVAKDKEIAPVVGGAATFSAFIQEELIPKINTTYRTTAKKGILGESLSGYFVMECLFERPELFDYYIAFDPSIWWNNSYYVRMAAQKLEALPNNDTIRLWFAGSNATDISQNTIDLANILKQENKPNIVWHYSDEPNEQHATIFRATKVKAIVWTLGK